MNWDWIQRGAKAKGVLVYAIDQAQTPPRTQPGPWGNVDGGYCAGLAANWIALAYQGKDFPFSNLVCDDPPWQATAAQTVDADAGFTTWVNEWQVIVSYFSCSANGLKAEFAGAPTAAFICQAVFRAYGCYGISFRKPGGGHTVAMRNGRDGRLHLFDPNYFHVAAKDPDVFQSFVSWWLDSTEYDQRYTKLTGVIGIRPPINHKAP
jgi:hypothetical protein